MLFELLLESARVGERVEEVWRSAVGTLVHLLSEQGVFDAQLLDGLSNEVLRAAVDVARRYSW
jgi:hypothetical protein